MWFKRLTSRADTLSDTRLLQLYASTGELKYLGDLYDRYTPMVYGVCLKYLQHEADSQDAVMQIFEKLVVSLQKTEVQQFKSWLYITVKNHCLMQLRRQKPRAHGTDGVVEQLVGDDPHEVAVDRWPLVEEGLATLPAEQQRCLRLFYLEQKSYQEVANLTGYELKKVKSYLQNGKRNLKIYVENHE